MTLADARLFDLSSLPRLGFKGSGTMPVIRSFGFSIEDVPNRAYRQADGVLCLVLAASETFLLGPAPDLGNRLLRLEQGWSIDNHGHTYPLLRRHSHAWLALQGARGPEILAKLCAVDMRQDKFGDLSVSQTSVARLNSIVLRADFAGHPTYHWLADSAAAAYMLSCLQDAADEFGGKLAPLESWTC